MNLNKGWATTPYFIGETNFTMLYLIRHAQAGPRGNYDELSSLGLQQAQLLGAHFAQQNVRFDAVYAGNLQRQQDTARLVNARLNSGAEIITDERWNEFKLGEVYQSIAAHLAAEDEAFARDFAEMKMMLSENGYTMAGAVARCDRAVMRAWLTDRFPAEEYEPWPDFQARVQAGFAALLQHSAQEIIAVFTSATPIAIAVGAALQLTSEKMMGVAWVMYNSGMTTMKLRDGAFHLYTLNATPHLLTAELQTFR